MDVTFIYLLGVSVIVLLAAFTMLTFNKHRFANDQTVNLYLIYIFLSVVSVIATFIFLSIIQGGGGSAAADTFSPFFVN